jgi:hypothetical protein
MAALRPIFNDLVKSLPPSSVEQPQLDNLVEDALRKAEGKSSVENRRSQWDYLCKNEAMKLAVSTQIALSSVMNS